MFYVYRKHFHVYLRARGGAAEAAMALRDVMAREWCFYVQLADVRLCRD